MCIFAKLIKPGKFIWFAGVLGFNLMVFYSMIASGFTSSKTFGPSIFSGSKSLYHTVSKSQSITLFATVSEKAEAKLNIDPNEKPKRRKGGDQALEVVLIGLSHHNAAVDVREKLAIPEDQWNAASNELCSTGAGAIQEAAVLSTCNRFELYLAGQNQYECIRDALQYLEKRGNLNQEMLRKNIFMLTGEDAIWHSLRVSVRNSFTYTIAQTHFICQYRPVSTL